MNRLAAVLTVATVLLGAYSATALASTQATSNAGVVEYTQQTTVPVTQTNKEKNGGSQGTNGSNNGSGGNSNSGNGVGDVNGQSEGNGDVSAVDVAQTSSADSSGVAGLPFTGFDVLALAAIGALLVGAGFAQRRFTAGRHTA